MKITDIPRPLRGIIPPMISPLLATGELDGEGLERTIAHLLEGKVAGVFLLGTTGEGMSLSDALREELIRQTCRQIGGRIPVLASISHASLEESLQLARFACDAGADAVVITPPSFIPPTQSELLEYLALLTSRLPLPLFLYNIPVLTRVEWALDTVRRSMDNPAILGIKDSSGDLKYFQHLCEMGSRRPDWTVLMGPEELLASAMQIGGHGGICGGANVFPKLYVALYEAIRIGESQRLKELIPLARRIQKTLFPVNCSIGDGIRSIKAAMRGLGICLEYTAPPLRYSTEEERKELQRQISLIAGDVAAILPNGSPILRGTHYGQKTQKNNTF
jgi:dihydrodipicolinate synthase/N-acetylneuraminate lyase